MSDNNFFLLIKFHIYLNKFILFRKIYWSKGSNSRNYMKMHTAGQPAGSTQINNVHNYAICFMKSITICGHKRKAWVFDNQE